MMARQENPLKGRDLPLTIPAEADDYLILLGSLGKLGKNRTEVATHILVRELHRLDNEKYHLRRVPKPKSEPPPDSDAAASSR
jgi:hypothetical protein